MADYFCLLFLSDQEKNDRTNCKYGWTGFDTGFFSRAGGGGGGRHIIDCILWVRLRIFFVGGEGGKYMYLLHV